MNSSESLLFPIYVIIPTHKRVDRLTMLLESIKNAELPPNLAEILVVENGSQMSKDAIESFKSAIPLRYFYYEIGNKSEALNFVMPEIPDHAFIVFFDDDIKIDTNVLQRFADSAALYGYGYYLGGGLRSEYEKIPDSNLLPFLPASAKSFDLSNDDSDRKFNKFVTFLGANWGCFKSDLNLAGGFSSSFGPGSISKARGQESEAQFRLFENGVRPVAISNATVDHWVPAKVATKKWVLDRVFHSSILHGESRSSLKQNIVFLLKISWGIITYLIGFRGISNRVSIAHSLGYFKGLISR